MLDKKVLKNYEVRQILKVFLDKDELSLMDVAESRGIDDKKAKENLEKLKEGGYVKQEKDKVYYITEEGKKAFAEELKKRKKEVEELLKKIGYN
ncbi:MAG: Mn-dependent transcriptional regulator DtxR family [Candidatus Methanohalarchaeum thermophilum]|uniref:Mn-dependent transcriptional regulator DtxR family n=1 Tax=Methanohalarchaeum thermophilum TaxID=1903181 RepID=A0A1Q6DWW4_METT1|nr:MAG: Mn-dependent transcriptional regulator DtxR family [Candidatus Methanohalarchaeum thermophilum]